MYQISYNKFVKMKKFFFALLLTFLTNAPVFAESYYFKECKLSNAVLADYIINIDEKIIDVTLLSLDGQVQNFSDKIKVVEKNQIISEKIESGKGDDIYFEYYLNAKTKTLTKLQYKKEGGADMNIFKLQLRKVSNCLNIKADWDLKKIEKAEINKEQEKILQEQKKIKDEQSSKLICEGDNYKKWTNCKGAYTNDEGYNYDGLFVNGEIIKGIAIFPGGAKYVGEFKNFIPHGYGNFAWVNGDRYFGEWKNGKTDGNGTKIWAEGREYSGTFKNDKLHGKGTIYYNDGKKFVGEFLNDKRHGEGTFTYQDGTSFVGNFVAGKQQGLGLCFSTDGSSVPCKSKSDTQTKDFSGKETHNISIVAKKWVRISQYETNSKKGKKVMDKLKADFDLEAIEICKSKENYNVLKKEIEVLDLDETPAYGLETKLQIGINGVIECKKN